MSARATETKLFKIHGTIDKDVSFGDNSRIIITEGDYDQVYDYREHLYNTLKSDLTNSDLVIIGSSLADSDIKTLITKAIQLNSQALPSGRITLLMYQKDEDRALLYEMRGLKVVFSGIDEFFAELSKKSPGPLFDYKPQDDVLEKHISLVPTVVEVSHEVETDKPDVSRMFNGWPAGYADISKGVTFARTISDTISNYVLEGSAICAALLGASGVGKTTATRQVLIKLKSLGYTCWEHKSDYYLQASDWFDLSKNLKQSNRLGVLFVDDAQHHLREINELIDLIASDGNRSLFILLSSTRNNWRPRIKTPQFYKNGQQFYLSKLDTNEIDRLLLLVENTDDLSQLIESNFAGFTKSEKRRRLVERCESDMFVCMRNIFDSDSFDDIILREFAALPDNHQDIYRLVSALETSGVRVHR